MAARARLIPPQQERVDWPWHHVRATTLHASDMWSGERRLEADTYLGTGYGIRLAFEAKTTGWGRFDALARSWMPGRLKGTVVAPSHGQPYLSATQMLDLRPSPRRFLSVSEKLADELTVEPGTILVTRSGSVGKSTVAHRLHEGIVVSDDLLRVVPLEAASWGWIYAYLRAPSTRQMMTSVRYGHMIKHLEAHHLNALPIPTLSESIQSRFNALASEMLRVRNKAFDKLLQAESLFEEATGGPFGIPEARLGFSQSVSKLGGGRRRLEASFHHPHTQFILDRFAKQGLNTAPLCELSDQVWWGARFRRVFGDGGIPYYSADDLWTLNPSATKRILMDHEGAASAERYMVKSGWLIMACSGQVYGLNGSVDLVTEKLASSFLSHDLIRIAPSNNVRSGYLLVALGHPLLGRPLVIRNAYGSSIPHLDPDDIAATPIVRLDSKLEDEIADAAEDWVRLRHEADDLENKISADAEEIIEQFLAGSPL